MRNIVFLLIVLFLSTSCKKKITQFYLDYNSSVVVQSTAGQLIPFSLMTPEMSTNSQFEFESNNTNKKHINSIFLEQLKLTVSSPPGQTFSFLNSVELYISSPNHSEKKIAFKENIGSDTSFYCDLVDLDLQNFVKDDKFTIRVLTVTDETLAQDVTIDLFTNFLVDAKLVK